MYILQVQIRVKEECVDAFLLATRANAEASRREPGVARFDILQELADSTRFQIFEAYRDQESHAAHRETAHYALWRDTVAAMMAEPRAAVKYRNV